MIKEIRILPHWLQLRYGLLFFVLVVAFSKIRIFYMEKNYINLKKEKKQLEEDIKLLEIEWLYLNQDAKLKALADKFLQGWKQLEGGQIKLQRNVTKNQPNIQ